MVSIYPQNPEYNRSLSYTYNLNTKYRPLSAAITDAKGAKSTLVFTCQ